MKQCTKCKEIKPDTEFHKDRKTKTGLSCSCKSCRTIKNKQRWRNNKDALAEKQEISKSERIELVNSLKTPCKKCGESRLHLIQFHHIDPKLKLFGVQQISSHGKNAVVNEAKKCVCLCANCHMEFHWLYGRHPINPTEALDKYLGKRLELSE